MKKEKIHPEILRHNYELLDRSRDILTDIMETMDIENDFKKKIWWDLYHIECRLDKEKENA